MGQPFSSSSTEPSTPINSNSSVQRVGSQSETSGDGSATPPSLARAASIAAHHRVIEQLLTFQQNHRTNSSSDEESLSSGQVPQIVVEETPTLTQQIRNLIIDGQLLLRDRIDSMLSESDDDFDSPPPPRQIKRTNHCILTLPADTQPESQKSYNEFRMDVIDRAGLSQERNLQLLIPNSERSCVDMDEIKEEQLFQPSSSSWRTTIKNLRLGLGRKFPNSYEREKINGRCCFIADSEMTRMNNCTTPNRRKIIDKNQTKVFCLGWVNNGTGILTASQDNKIRIYQQACLRKRYVLKRKIEVPFVGWSILDVDVSPDGRFVVYSTWNNVLYQYDLQNKSAGWQDMLFENDDTRYGVFSIKFNSTGTELVAGATKGLYVYSREIDQCVLRVNGHDDDINAVCFVDDSSNLILSSGDDGLINMWDRRTMDMFGEGKPVCQFAGHRDGVTFIDSRKDNRYFLTNSKDQTIKVWDVRLPSSKEGIEATKRAVRSQNWDYRWQYTPVSNFKTSNLPGDSSILTLRGHSVLHTLIRARFSPDHTGKRFIYTGCARGGCVVYDIFTVDVHKKFCGHKSVVRDALWHPYDNEIITSSWDGTVYAWRYDRRGPTTCDLDNDSQCLQPWDSTDEFDEPFARSDVDETGRSESRKRRLVSNANPGALRRGPPQTRLEIKIAQEDSSSDTDEGPSPLRIP
uniref:WD repeat-containing protein 23 n=1 Tax=Panagrolaimus sp. JU765 TaxID=591449 RepID=A0AC34QJQ8_9BILA